MSCDREPTLSARSLTTNVNWLRTFPRFWSADSCIRTIKPFISAVRASVCSLPVFIWSDVDCSAFSMMVENAACIAPNWAFMSESICRVASSVPCTFPNS